MRGADGNETCPRCFHVLIELRDFDADADAVPVDRGGWSGGGRAWWEVGWFDEMFGRAWYRFEARMKNYYLRRILRRYPNSLYCTGCGFVRRIK